MRLTGKMVVVETVKIQSGTLRGNERSDLVLRSGKSALIVNCCKCQRLSLDDEGLMLSTVCTHAEDALVRSPDLKREPKRKWQIQLSLTIRLSSSQTVVVSTSEAKNNAKRTRENQHETSKRQGDAQSLRYLRQPALHQNMSTVH